MQRPAQPLFDYVQGQGSLLISFPHSGTYLPPDLASRLNPGVLDLPDTDWFVPRLYEFFADLGASIIRATHSRFMVDLNRPPDGAPLYPGQRETTVCPTETFGGEALYPAGGGPTPVEIAERLDAYWRPYHQRIAEASRDIARRHGRCLLWDAHSIRSQVPGLFDGRLPDLNIGTASGRTCSPALLQRVASALDAQSNFSFVIDGRFKGGYITRHYGDPAAGIDAMQLEIAQCAYLEEGRTPAFDEQRAQPLRRVLQALLQAAVGPASSTTAVP